MRIGKTNAIFGVGGGGGVVLNFVPLVAPESFNDPSKYADYGCTVNLYEKFRIYKMTYPEADVAVEFSDAVESVDLTPSMPGGTIIEMFETVLGGETSVLMTSNGTKSHTFTSGSTKRYMIRRKTSSTVFYFPVGSVWAYCTGINGAAGFPNTYLKYIFLHEYSWTGVGQLDNTALTGVLIINNGTDLLPGHFANCTNLTKVIIGNQLTRIQGTNGSGAFYQCTGLLEADLGTGIN